MAVPMNRRTFLSSAGMVIAAQSLDALLPAQTKQGNAPPGGKADHNLRIEPCTSKSDPA